MAQITRQRCGGLLTAPPRARAPGGNRQWQQLGARTRQPRALTEGASVVARARLAGIQTQHMAGNRGEPPAGGQLALRVTLHAQDERLARGCGAGTSRMQRLLQLGEHVWAVVGLAPEHDAVAPAERLERRVWLAQTAVD